MSILHLGVVDVAYSSEQGAETTGEVAEHIESEYHVMQVFYDAKQQKIADELVAAMARSIENMQIGIPKAQINLERIDAMFRDFLDLKEWSQITGTTLEAARQGVSSRFKNSSNKVLKTKSIVAGAVSYTKVHAKARPARPEFIDSGLYQQAFRTWLTQS